MSLTFRNSLLLVLTAFIWGSAFVAQSTGGDVAGPYAFTCIRSFIACFYLYIFIRVVDLKKKAPPQSKESKRILWKAGTLCGIALSVASNLQQVGITLGTPAGKSGFLTACYIILVPILGIFFKRKCSAKIWFCVLITLVGLYLLCLTGETFSIRLSDTLLLLCALAFAVQILIIDKYIAFVNGVKLSCIQFLVVAVTTLIPMFLVDANGSVENFCNAIFAFNNWNALFPLLYAAILSSGIAYTLQIVAQRGMNPTLASLLMSLESVFAVLSGWLLLGESMSIREIVGCVLMGVAIVLAQLPKRHSNF